MHISFHGIYIYTIHHCIKIIIGDLHECVDVMFIM